MRVVLQRVSEASVTVDDDVVGEIGPGLLLLVGVAEGDTEADVEALVRKVTRLRVFRNPDEPERRPIDVSVTDAGHACLVVSQFTLLASMRKGNRPSFTAAEAPDRAAALCHAFAEGLRAAGVTVATGRFGASMAVALVNDGPVTILLEARGGKVL